MLRACQRAAMLTLQARSGMLASPALPLSSAAKPLQHGVTPAVEAIHLHSKQKVLEVRFTDGQVFGYSAELLRVTSPSAENRVQTARGDVKVVAGRRHVGIMRVEPVGSYAIRIHFDDLHHTGIYTWDSLHRLGRHKFTAKREYLRLLRRQGLSRDPTRGGPPPRRAGGAAGRG